MVAHSTHRQFFLLLKPREIRGVRLIKQIKTFSLSCFVHLHQELNRDITGQFGKIAPERSVNVVTLLREK